jgi:DNA-binding transcriptional regulator GbsR (MarR family)
MKATTAQARAEFIQLWSRLGQFWGIPAGTSRVYAWLLSCPDGAWSEEIMDGLTMSRGAVSMACKELRDWGLVTAVQDPGVRKTRHEVETDLATVVRNIVQARKRREWDPILEGVRDWIPRLESDGTPAAQVFRERLESIEACVGMADGMAQRFLDGGLLSNLGLKTLTTAARTRRRMKRSDRS